MTNQTLIGGIELIDLMDTFHNEYEEKPKQSKKSKPNTHTKSESSLFDNLVRWDI